MLSTVNDYLNKMAQIVIHTSDPEYGQKS